nr:hypothetical protein [Escherichia coli]
MISSFEELCVIFAQPGNSEPATAIPGQDWPGNLSPFYNAAIGLRGGSTLIESICLQCKQKVSQTQEQLDQFIRRDGSDSFTEMYFPQEGTDGLLAQTVSIELHIFSDGE